jgi:hypothetical protein
VKFTGRGGGIGWLDVFWQCIAGAAVAERGPVAPFSTDLVDCGHAADGTVYLRLVCVHFSGIPAVRIFILGTLVTALVLSGFFYVMYTSDHQKESP